MATATLKKLSLETLDERLSLSAAPFMPNVPSVAIRGITSQMVAQRQLAAHSLAKAVTGNPHQTTTVSTPSNVQGAATGYEKRLEIVGVGYQAAIKGKSISLRVGLANELVREIPPELTVTCPDATHIVIQGANKQQVGQFAAELRSLRKPEPYKGKGVRYQGEYVKIKPGKAATK